LSNFQIRPINSTDAEKVVTFLRQNWGSTRVVSRGRLYYPEKLPGFIATADGKSVGLLTYEIMNRECEVVTINSTSERLGIGSGLLEAVRKVAISAACKRLWLITTNDNTHALRFYQKRGFRLAALYPNQLENSRLLKPEIPLVGMDGIPLRDEIELEILL
jgi:ribosomal protein S18 acetylase RimI-like enzyme